MPKRVKSEASKQLAVANHGKVKKNLKKAFELRFHHGLNYSQIGSQLGVSKEAVLKQLKPFEPIVKSLTQSQTYTTNAPEILGAVEFNIIRKMVSEEVLKKASLNNLAYAFQNIHNARRLESGQSTANIAVNVEQTLADALRKAKNDVNKINESVSSNE